MKSEVENEKEITAEGVKIEASIEPEELTEESKVQQLELDLQASVALVAERDALIEATAVTVAENKELFDSAQLLVKDLSVIVAQAVGNISIALNVKNTLAEDADAAAILAAYTEKSQIFTAQFPTGGVAAVGADDEDSKESVKEIELSRFDTALHKQTVDLRK